MPYVFEDAPVKGRYVFDDEPLSITDKTRDTIGKISEAESRQGRVSHPAISIPDTKPTRGLHGPATISAPPTVPTPGQEAIQADPWFDPATIAEVGLTMGAGTAIKQGLKYGVKQGLKTFGRQAVATGVSAVADLPLSKATELVAKDHPYLAYPFNVLMGIFSNVVPESFITGKILKAVSGKNINPDILDATVKQVKSAIDAGQPDEADRIIRNLATAEDIPLKSKATVENIPKPEKVGRYVMEEPVKPPPEIDHKVIASNEKINAITREQAGKLIAKGDPEVIHHIEEGVQAKGKMALQDAIRNEEMKVYQQANKGPERDAVMAHIQELTPEIDAALKGEQAGSVSLKHQINTTQNQINEIFDTIKQGRKPTQLLYDKYIGGKMTKFNSQAEALKKYALNDLQVKRVKLEQSLKGQSPAPPTPSLASIIKSGRKTITPEELSKLPDVVSGQRTIADMKAYLEIKGIRVASKVTPPSKIKPFNPETDSITDMIRKGGGISLQKEVLKGEIKDRFSIREGHNLINNKTGKTLDHFVERAKEEGFLGEKATVRDLLDLMRQDVDAKAGVGKGRVWSPKRQVYAEPEIPRDDQARILRDQRATKEIPSTELQEGDTFKKQGEKFKVTDVQENGTVTLKDGETIKLGPDEAVKYDRGTLKKSESAPAPKEPWQMTYREWLKHEAAIFGDIPKEPSQSGIGWHKGKVFTAISEGKPVPPEVLKDYPELQAKTAPEPAFVKTDIKGEEQAIWRGKGFDAEFPAGKLITPEEMRGKPKPKIEGQEDIFSPTPKETEKQQGLFAGSSAADVGGYAPPRGTAEGQYVPPKGLSAMEMPEIVELAKAISGGKYPQVKAKLSHRLAVGLFRTSTGNIELKANIFKDPNEAQKVLSHEIGHLVDWLPDNDISRGNILGRIASLKKYMGRLLEEYPDSPNKRLTPEDRARIRKEAERLAKGTAKTTIEVEEQIIKELPLKSDDIMKIMNDVGGEIRQTDKKLYDWFAELSGDEKKSILKEALKGRVPDWVSFKKTVIEGVRTVKKTIYETVDPRKKYHEMIINEIRNRRLYQYETIMDELKGLSKEWKPFDESKVHAKYVKYRYSSKELYADSISVLFNDPALLKARAPNYYKAFFAYMERKPEVSAIYEDIQNRLTRGHEDIFRQRDINIEDMFKRGEKAYAESLKRPPLEVWKSIKKSMVDVNTEAIHKVKEVEKRGIKIPSEANPRYWIEELPYMSGPVKQYYSDIENLVRNTASDVDIGKYMFAMRARTERATLANPLGVQQKNAIDYIDYLKAKDPEQYAKIEEAVNNFRMLRQTQIIPEIEKAEMFDDQMMKLMRDNEHYATFDIVKYIEKRYGRNISGHIHKQIGTLNETANPFTATIMKDSAMLRNAHVTQTKKVIVKFLQDNFPGDITPADTRWNGRYHEVINPKDPNKGLVAFLHKGKMQGFYVDKEIADTFYKDPFKGGVMLKAWMALSQPLKDLLVSKNPWFMLWNIQRDAKATAKQLPGASLPKALYYALRSAPDAYKDVMKDIHTPDVAEMYKGKMLITGRAYGKDVNPDSQLERMMQEFLIKPQEYNNKVIQPLKQFWDFMDKPGQFSERLFKIAGYKYLKANTNLPDKEIAHLVRTRAGSPDFMRGGKHRLFYNNIFLFSNAGKEGWRSSIEAYKENPARYIWKTIEYDILPKVAMFAAAGGLFGDDIKRWFQKVPERDKANYQIIPIGETPDGKAVYFRIPHDFTGQAVAGLAWKAMNQYENMNIQDVLDYSAGGLPYTGLHPFIGLTVDTYQYMTGKNPYNTFTGRYVIPEQVFEAGGLRAAEEFGKHAANQFGIGIVYKFKGADLRETSSELEKLIGYPIIGRGIERFMKVSDYGLTEKIKRTVEPVRQERAQENVAITDRIIADVKGRKGVSEQDIKKLYTQLINEGILTRKEYSDFRDTYKLMAIRKVGDPYIKAYMAAQSNEEKMAILELIRKEKGGK